MKSFVNDHIAQSAWLKGTEIIRTIAAFLLFLPLAFIDTLLAFLFTDRVKIPPAAFLKETLLMCIAAQVPLRIIQKHAVRVDRNSVTDSKRYRFLKAQILEHVLGPGFSGYWICCGLQERPIDPQTADICIFYIHGGGYVLGSPLLDAANFLYTAEVLAESGLKVAIFALEYGLAPDHRFPEQVQQALAAYRWMLNQLAISPSKLAIVGESAGGHLSLSLLASLNREASVLHTDIRQQIPGYLFLISPWCNLNTSNPKATNVRPAELNFKRALKAWGELTLGSLNSQDRRFYENFAQRAAERGSWKDILPRNTWTSAGTEEAIFVHDIEDFIKDATADGVVVHYEKERGGTHAWQNASARSQHTELLGQHIGSCHSSLLIGYKRLAQSIIAMQEQYSSDGELA